MKKFAPVLALPEKKAGKNWIQANIDEDGRIEIGVFGLVDFDRYKPKFDKMLMHCRSRLFLKSGVYSIYCQGLIFRSI